MRYVAVLCFIVGGASASAVTLDATMTADNGFFAYVSTDDSVEGTQFLSGHNWPQEFTGSVELTAGVTNYLHIKAFNDGGPAMFIGEFTLSDSSARFENGTQTLLTNTTEWEGNLTGFGNAYSTPLDFGPDGTGPWGNFTNIDDNARFIWMDAQLGTGNFNYFTVAITVDPVPEPGTLAVLGLGVAALARRRRK